LKLQRFQRTQHLFLGDRSAVNLLAQTPIGPSQGILST
jgi:hypothetical protein